MRGETEKIAGGGRIQKKIGGDTEKLWRGTRKIFEGKHRKILKGGTEKMWGAQKKLGEITLEGQKKNF